MIGTAKIDAVTLTNLFATSTTHFGDNFLLFDEIYRTRVASADELLGFQAFLLEIARRGSGVFLGDGTFDSVPTMFKQLYTIHAEVDGSAFPIVFVLMEERTAEAYERVFNALKAKGLMIRTFMTDFETASRNAVRNVFSDVAVKGCWFHFTQAIMRRTKKLGLEGAYRSSEFVNRTIRRLFGLAFVEVAEVEDAISAIEETISQVSDDETRQKLFTLMQYFRKTWISKYKPTEWNQFRDVSLRTNNWSEAFHAAFSRRFTRAHPNVRVVIEALKNVESHTRIAWNEFNHNLHARKSKETFIRELRRILKRKESRWAGDLLGFLDAVSKIPVFLLLQFEKKQLEYWREHVNGSGETLDEAERRISEVDSLLETRSPSLVKSVEFSERNDSVCFGVITKRTIERRKQKLLAKIRRKQADMTGRKTVSRVDEAVGRIDFDEMSMVRESYELDESPICRVVDDTPLETMQIADETRTPTSSIRRQRSRRRKSVVSKMNNAIRRRRGR